MEGFWPGNIRYFEKHFKAQDFFALLIHYLNTLRPTHRVLSIDWTLYPPKNFIYRSLYIYFLYPQVLASTHEDLIYAFDLRLHNSMTCWSQNCHEHWWSFWINRRSCHRNHAERQQAQGGWRLSIIVVDELAAFFCVSFRRSHSFFASCPT